MQQACYFLTADEVSSNIAHNGWTLLGGPFPDSQTCVVNCGSSSSSQSISVGPTSSGSLIVSSTTTSPSSKLPPGPSSSSSLIVSISSSSSAKLSSSSTVKSPSSSIVSSSSLASSAPSSIASSAVSSPKSSLVSSISKSSTSPHSFGPRSSQSSGSVVIVYAPACINDPCVNDPHYNTDPNAGPLGIQWPINLFAVVNYDPSFGPDPNCTYVPDGGVIPLTWIGNAPAFFPSNAAWLSPVYVGNGAITQLNAAVISGQRYGDFNRFSPVNCPPIQFAVSCGNGFANELFLWIFFADLSGQVDAFSPLTLDQLVSCFPLQTGLQWQPSGDQWQFSTWSVFQ